MAVLLLRFAGPLQAWGTTSKFETRRTENFPTKSGVIGMIASAMGRSRIDSIDDLAQLDIGIRVEDPGQVMSDYHTVKPKKGTPYITTRCYLNDAVFLVGVESEDEQFLGQIEEALHHPAYPLFLGRRSCPPEQPLVLEQKQGSLESVLTEYPWTLSDYRKEKMKRRMRYRDTKEIPARILLPASSITDGMLIKDQPESFSPVKRMHKYRPVAEKIIRFPSEDGQDDLQPAEPMVEHDAFGMLEEADHVS